MMVTVRLVRLGTMTWTWEAEWPPTSGMGSWRAVFRLGTLLGIWVGWEPDWAASCASISSASPLKSPSATFFTVSRYRCQAPLPVAVALSTTCTDAPDDASLPFGASTVYQKAPRTATRTPAAASSCRVLTCCRERYNGNALAVAFRRPSPILEALVWRFLRRLEPRDVADAHREVSHRHPGAG